MTNLGGSGERVDTMPNVRALIEKLQDILDKKSETKLDTITDHDLSTGSMYAIDDLAKKIVILKQAYGSV